MVTIAREQKDYSPSFDEWVMSREIMCWGTNAGTESIAYQRWRHFKEAFAPELIKRAVTESSIPVRTCLDPFGGSGTTALACQFLGVHPRTIEVNPYLADLIESKLRKYNILELTSDFGKLISDSYKLQHDVPSLAENLPKTFFEPGDKGRWLFNIKVAERISCLLNAISKIENASHQQLFKSLLGGVLVDASNVIVNGKGRRYRNNWESRPPAHNHLDDLFQESVKSAIGDIARYGKRACQNYSLMRGDSRDLTKESGPVDLCVFSPPYPNSFDYTDVYNIELWILGHLTSKESNRELRNQTLSSHVQVHRFFAPTPIGSETLNKIISELKDRRKSLWNTSIPEMIGAYFSDLLQVISGVHHNLSDSGTMWMVVGDSKYAGIIIPTAKIITELLALRGWALEKIEPFRSMRVSPQQGGQLGLDETLIVFKKVS